MLAALGLAAAAGLNAWLPLMFIAVLARAGWVDVAPAFVDLTRTSVVLVLVALFLLDFVSDKRPGVDGAMHAAGLVVHPAAGALLCAAQAGDHAPLIVRIVVGAAVAATVHVARATARAPINASTAGLGAPLASLLEDLASALLVACALLLPLASGVLAIVLTGGGLVLTARTPHRATARPHQPPP